MIRVTLEILAWAFGLLVILAVARGLAPVSSGLLRILLSPVTLVAIVAIVVLVRLRPHRS